MGNSNSKVTEFATYKHNNLKLKLAIAVYSQDRYEVLVCNFELRVVIYSLDFGLLCVLM